MSTDDPVDQLIQQWERERPDLELDAMATIGRLGRLSVVAGRAVESVFLGHGISTGEFDVLAALRRAGEPFTLSPTVLARTLMLSPAGMTNRLDRLEAADLVERRADPGDRRASLVVLTRRGHELVDRAVTDHVANEERILSVLSRSERAALDRTLRKLLAQFDT